MVQRADPPFWKDTKVKWHSEGVISFSSCRWHGEYRKCADLFKISKTDDGFCCSFNTISLAEGFAKAEVFEESKETEYYEEYDYDLPANYDEYEYDSEDYEEDDSSDNDEDSNDTYNEYSQDDDDEDRDDDDQFYFETW